jgi:glycosyltransferase involved in cell wall biosynthesis
MISIITPTYNTLSHILARTWASLKAQTHTDWAWVVWDDSTNESVWRQLWGFAADERFYIEAHRSLTPTGGNIGLIKRRLGMVSEGDIIVELDHDDELTPDALERIAEAFEDPEVGFVYSDWCEINAQGQSCRYPDGWAFGYGSDYWDEEHGVWAMRAPEVNQTTLRHIVSMPNHVRAWRSSVYRELGGHDSSLPVADDYDLCVRTCLATKIVHIPKMLYKQHIAPTTAQRSRNAQIQALVKQISEQYSPQIDQYHTT